MDRVAYLSRAFIATCCMTALGGAACAAGAVDGANPAGLDLFEKKIRPVLVETCFKCHSSTSEKLKGGLLLDSRDGMLTGGDTGPAIIPGNPSKSLLIKAIRGVDGAGPTVIRKSVRPLNRRQCQNRRAS